MNFRLIGLNMCLFAFIAGLVALVLRYDRMLTFECAIMITGAVLSLHKPKGS